MKKQLFFLCAMLALTGLSLNANAKVWRLNNNAGVSCDFTNFPAAQTGAASGDTIYVEGSSLTYGDISLTKPLVIIGTGYFLNQNPQTQANINSAKFGNISFGTGSSGAVISGLEITAVVNIAVGNITVMKNLIEAVCVIDRTSSFGNIIFTQNYFSGTGIANIHGPNTIYNVIVSNNIFSGNFGLDYDSYNSFTFTNNIFTLNGQSFTVYNSVFTNNILKSLSLGAYNCTWYNNILDGPLIPAVNGNQPNVDMTKVFVASGTTDGYWQLKTASPALGAGTNGTDCGIFGGLTPYMLSGMPGIPAIYSVSMPATGSSNNGINVTVKAKIH